MCSSLFCAKCLSFFFSNENVTSHGMSIKYSAFNFVWSARSKHVVTCCFINKLLLLVVIFVEFFSIVSHSRKEKNRRLNIITLYLNKADYTATCNCAIFNCIIVQKQYHVGCQLSRLIHWIQNRLREYCKLHALCNSTKLKNSPESILFPRPVRVIWRISSFHPRAFLPLTMSKHSGDEIEPLRDGQTVPKTSTFRRIAPQVTP